MGDGVAFEGADGTLVEVVVDVYNVEEVEVVEEAKLIMVKTDGDTRGFSSIRQDEAQPFRTCALHGEVQSLCAVYSTLVKVNTVK